MAIVTPTQISRYQVVDLLGQGGMGSVYLARDPKIGRLIAIKLLKEEFDESLREQFRNEARSVGQLDHINIVTIHDVGDHAGRPFIAMSYIPGETLADMIRRRAPLPVLRRLRIIEELCAGLHAAHKAGIVHRDVKPANVMVDPQGVVKIVDFGIARLASEATQRTQDTTIMGSYNYMSPEQITGKSLNHRSDVFSVGAVFYEVLAYARAFPGTLRDGLWYRLVHEPPPSLRELCPDLDADIERIVQRALEKDPAARYQEMDAMRRDIALARKRLLAGELEALVAGAQQALEVRDFTAALENSQAALALETDDPRAIDLNERARRGADEQRIRAHLERARFDITLGELAAASTAIDDALAIDSTWPDAVRLKTELRELDQKGHDAVAAADRRAAQGDLDGAIAQLAAFTTPHTLVSERLAELRLTNAPRPDPRRSEASTGRLSSHDRLERARTLHATGQYKEALKTLDALQAHASGAAADFLAELEQLRDQVETAFTKQIVEQESARVDDATPAITTRATSAVEGLQGTPQTPERPVLPEARVAPVVDPDDAPTVVIERPPPPSPPRRRSRTVFVIGSIVVAALLLFTLRC